MTLSNLCCPLCGADCIGPFAHAHQKDYFECHICRLVFLDPNRRLASDEEQKRYKTHQNDPSDTGYRNFLNRLAHPLITRLTPKAVGLDYGSGPGPTLSVMLERHGFSMAIYDPFFAPIEEVLTRTYDFVTCTETVEHFFYPDREFNQLNRLLRPGGWLGIMTEIRQEERAFEQWYYVRDPTHVCFYHAHTMLWLAEHFGWILQSPHQNVFFFQKPLS